jgi:hypothetical protein
VLAASATRVERVAVRPGPVRARVLDGSAAPAEEAEWSRKKS